MLVSPHFPGNSGKTAEKLIGTVVAMVRCKGAQTVKLGISAIARVLPCEPTPQTVLYAVSDVYGNLVTVVSAVSATHARQQAHAVSGLRTERLRAVALEGAEETA